MAIISLELGERLKRAAEQASEFKTTYEQIVPRVGTELEDLAQMRTDLKMLTQKADTLHSELSVIYGYMQEGQEIAREHWDKIAQTATLGSLLDIWFQSEPKQIAHVLEIADPEPLRQAIRLLPKDRQDLLKQIFED